MQPWEQLDSTTVPGTTTEMSLHRRGDVFSIRVGAVELMNNWIYGIDCGLADHGCAALSQRDTARVLIGGLGMGFTLARTLAKLGPKCEVVVAELVPAVVRWNEELLGDLAHHPLRDPRTKIVQRDVAELIRAEPASWDAILLDVDNGPEGLSRKGNDKLYSKAGLAAAREALRPRGVLGIWSLSGDRSFHGRMKRGGFEVSEHLVKKRGGRARQLIFVGRPSDAARSASSKDRARSSSSAARKSNAASGATRQSSGAARTSSGGPSARRKPGLKSGGGRPERRT
ncbi:MAG: spermidine synthase [Planctomycetota bacterium]|nr:MAG: spermidine synthase [Planctomycetota bacterium]